VDAGSREENVSKQELMRETKTAPAKGRRFAVAMLR
jgi:hypothetical protein